MILIYFSGGTIGMQPGPDGLVLSPDCGEKLSATLMTLRERRPTIIPEFTVHQGSKLFDSSDATPADWHRIGSEIIAMSGQYDGFVVLHGSDSLAWCASALAFQLIGLGKPVVVTGAQAPLGSPTGGDAAAANVEGALRFAAEPKLQEVALYFSGKLMRGCRAQKWHAQDVDGFESPRWPLLGRIEDNIAAFYPTRALGPPGADVPRPPHARFMSPELASRVVRISVWPGMRASLLRAWLLDPGTGGAVIECLGSGSLPHDEELHAVLREVKAAGKVLLTVTQCQHGQIDPGTYASRRVLQELGVVSGGDMTVEAAFCKLHYVIAALEKRPEEIRRWLAVDIVGELSTGERPGPLTLRGAALADHEHA